MKFSDHTSNLPIWALKSSATSFCCLALSLDVNWFPLNRKWDRGISLQMPEWPLSLSVLLSLFTLERGPNIVILRYEPPPPNYLIWIYSVLYVYLIYLSEEIVLDVGIKAPLLKGLLFWERLHSSVCLTFVYNRPSFRGPNDRVDSAHSAHPILNIHVKRQKVPLLAPLLWELWTGKDVVTK